MDGQRISDAEKREEHGHEERNEDKRYTVRVAGKTKNHSSVLCLGSFGVAR